MKKFLNLFAVVGVVVGLLAGCSTVQKLTPTQIAVVGVVISQTADTGAAYAIQQDKNNAKYFVLANSTIDTFVLGNDLSSAAFQNALNKVTGATNQWVSLAISGAVVAYDLALSQYVTDQLTNTPATVAWVSAVETGFKQALASTGTGLKASRPEVPYFIKDGKVDRDAIKAKLNEK
jgi:hypothetical protein